MSKTYVYLIKDKFTGLIKIGYSRNPEHRLKELCYQKTLLPMPNDFAILDAWKGCAEDERDIHQIFRKKRVRGEWFELDEKDIARIYYIFLGAPKYHFISRKHCEAGLNRRDNERTKEQLLDFIYEGFLPRSYYA